MRAFKFSHDQIIIMQSALCTNTQSVIIVHIVIYTVRYIDSAYNHTHSQL